MSERFTELRCKEVISVADGSRLGYVSDLELETESGRILALIVPCPGRFCGLLPGKDDFVIPWPCIRRIGDDIILVDVNTPEVRQSREKKRGRR